MGIFHSVDVPPLQSAWWV